MIHRLRPLSKLSRGTKTYRQAYDEIELRLEKLAAENQILPKAKLFHCKGGVGLLHELNAADLVMVSLALSGDYAIETWQRCYKLGLHS